MAYITGGHDRVEITDALLDPDGLYTYGMDTDSKAWITHQKEVGQAINIAWQLKEHKIPNYLNLIMQTPLTQMELLKNKYIKD